VAVMLEVARLLADVRTPHPVEYVAFGAEERFEARYAEKAHRGNGSQYHVAHLSPAERRRILGMVSLDMVGVGKVMQIGTLGEGSRRFADHLLWQAKACGVSAEYFVTKPWSDHVAFEQADIPAAWLWWWPDRDFHTPRDRWSRIDREKLRATARVTLRGLLRPLEE
jgi:Zn-dependent M28 family amino/carboxypeptidase